jgi:hypothetical protein
MARSIALVIHLGGLMLVFAVIGLILSPCLVTALHGYDHGFGESEWCALFATMGGALIGAVVHFVTIGPNPEP